MCAFSLATSSTPTDVLRHFHHIRLGAIRRHLEQNADVKVNAIKAMRLLLGTLYNTQLVFPRRLADSLVRLKDQPLIQQSDVQAVPELNLRIHARWLADELRNYTPWPRHDELQKSESEKILKTWAKSAQKVFLAGLSSALAEQESFEDVLDIRKELFEAWPWADSRLPGLHSADVVDQLREVINARLSSIIKTRVARLKLVCVCTRKEMESEVSVASIATTLWSPSVVDMDVTIGAERFKEQILSSYSGTSPSICRVIAAYDDWVSTVTAIQVQLKAVRDIRWDDDFSDELDNLDSRQTLLSEDDPRTLSKSLTSALDEESKALLLEFTNISISNGANERAGSLATMLLRVLREISRRAVLQDRLIAAVALPVTTSADVINPLQSTVAAFVAIAASGVLSKSLNRFARSRAVMGRTLWEGNPQLPSQPSTMVLKFLKVLTTEMANLGADLWSAGAVDALKASTKEMVAEHVDKAWLDIVAITSNSINGNTDHDQEDAHANGVDAGLPGGLDGEAPEPVARDDTQRQVVKDKMAQLALDLHYLRIALANSCNDTSHEQDLFIGVITKVIEAAEFGQSEVARLQKNATDYWKRTYLLFALLVPSI